jgi:hypothetical protein
MDPLAPILAKVVGALWFRTVRIHAEEHTHFYEVTGGCLEPTGDEVRAFLERCSAAGVRLRYRDGTELVGPYP